MLFRCQKDPIKELHRDLDVVLKVALSKLISRDWANIKDKFFTAWWKHFHNFLAFLHPHNRPVVKVNLDRMISISCESAQSIHLHLSYDFCASAHVLDDELCLLHRLLDCWWTYCRCKMCTFLLVEDKVLHELECIDQNFLQVDVFLSILLMSYLLERNRLMSKCPQSSWVFRTILCVLTNELTLVSQFHKSTILVKHNLSLLAFRVSESCRCKRCPPQKSIGYFIVEHVRCWWNVILHPDSNLLAVMGEFSIWK